MHFVKRIAVAALCGVAGTVMVSAARAQDAPPAAGETVPSDLRPLLAPRRSEMRLVIARYSADRTLLESNYAGPAGGGGLQLRGLRKELVDSKQMTQKAFHDEILRQGSMPIDLLRLALTKQKLTRDMSIDWNFYGELPDR